MPSDDDAGVVNVLVVVHASFNNDGLSYVYININVRWYLYYYGILCVVRILAIC